MAYLQSRGYRTIPVNPYAAGRNINGESVYARLADVPAPVDLVDVFRNSAAASGAVDEAIAEKDRLGIKFIWMQLGVRNAAAASRAEAAGILVVMDRCPKIEYPRLFGAAHRSTIAEFGHRKSQAASGIRPRPPACLGAAPTPAATELSASRPRLTATRRRSSIPVTRSPEPAKWSASTGGVA